ncbi:MAG: hypothetical protein GW823_08755 [Bacteroidetes bacterium]|nr:hypothetical protein [Bacteroidota bacterium]
MRILPANYLVLIFCLSILLNPAIGYSQAVWTKWVKIDNPAIGDTVLISNEFLSGSGMIYSKYGDIDTVSKFVELPQFGIKLVYLKDSLVNRIYFMYQIQSKSLYKSQQKVLNQIPNLEYLGSGDSVSIKVKAKDEYDLFGNSKLEKNGSLTRGITVGSNQDASLESGLRLDLSGEIADSISIIANLTDQSTPIQPDGSTQNLREFDRVYIQVKSPRHNLEVGDIDVTFNQSSFAYINRRLQGIQYGTSAFKTKHNYLATVAKGIFRSQPFQGIEGVQGPYRLIGNQAEPFIVVIAGTERVYLDGKLLTRGEDQDYIIDYGIGEIYFMPKLIINQRNRITVDFQYLNQDFSRTLVAAEAVSDPIFNQKMTIGASFIKESDNDNSLAQLSLSNEDIYLLENAGDDDDKAVTTGVKPFNQIDERTSNGIVYLRKDTLINGNRVTFFEFVDSGTPNENVFTVRFSRSTNGLGSYERAESRVNGLVYRFVGQGFGAYDTLKTLPRPLDHQMISLRSELKPVNGVNLKSEWAISIFDKNKFSTIDDSDNSDQAVFQELTVFKKADWAEISGKYSYKYNGERFRYFDRPEEIDFQRKWNLNSFTISKQQIHDFSTIIKFSPKTSLDVDGGLIERSDFTGNRIKSAIESREKGKLAFSITNEWIQSEDAIALTNGKWINHQAEVSYPFRLNEYGLEPFLKAIYDVREQKDLALNELNSSSYGQYSASSGIHFLPKSKFTFAYEFTLRDDASVYLGELKQDRRNYIQTISFKTRDLHQFQTANVFTFQKQIATKSLLNPGITNNDAVYLQSKSNYRSKSSAFEINLYYNVNSQRTALLQETYIETGPELGQYVWDDLNNDGQKQIDEFFPEQTPNEGTFLKQFLPSDNLFPTINLIARWRFNVNPSKLFSKRITSNAKKWAKLFNLSMQIDIREKSITQNLSDIYLLQLNSFQNDSTTITGRINLRTSLHLLPLNRFFSIRMGLDNGKSKNRQVFGSESNKINTYRIEILNRWNRNLNFNHELKISEEERSNIEIGSRSFRIQGLGLQSTIQVNQSRNINYSAEIGLNKNTDSKIGQNAKSTVLKIAGTTRLLVGERWQGSGRLQWRSIDLTGNSSSLGNFELTEGGGEGANWLWSVQASYRNSSFVQTSFNYDGRTIKNRPTIHTFRLVIRALF